MKHNGQTEELTAGTAPSLEDITPSPRLTNSPKGSGQTNATSVLLSPPGCGVGAADPRSERLLPLCGFRGGCGRGASRDESPSDSWETPPRGCAVRPRRLCVEVELEPGLGTLLPSPSRRVHVFRPRTLRSAPSTTSSLFRCTRRSIVARLFILEKVQTRFRPPFPQVEETETLFHC